MAGSGERSGKQTIAAGCSGGWAPSQGLPNAQHRIREPCCCLHVHGSFHLALGSPPLAACWRWKQTARSCRRDDARLAGASGLCWEMSRGANSQVQKDKAQTGNWKQLLEKGIKERGEKGEGTRKASHGIKQSLDYSQRLVPTSYREYKSGFVPLQKWCKVNKNLFQQMQHSERIHSIL